MKKLIAYDLDGTLADTREDIVLAANYMLQEMQKAPISPELIKSYVGKGLHDLVGQCLSTKDEKIIEKGTRIYRQHYSKHMMDHTCLYPGAADMLEHFKTRRQIVFTNKPSPFSENMLKHLGVADYFSAILTGSANHPPKPDPTGMQRILESEGITSQEVLFVGDSEVDLETGRRAGVDTVLIAHGFVPRDELESRRPRWLVGTFEELLRLVKDEGW